VSAAFSDSPEGATGSCPLCNESAKKLSALFKLIGNVGVCQEPKGCGASFYWVNTKAGRAAPINPDGTPHFATCPKSRNFRTKP
jgi:hypothetical protein